MLSFIALPTEVTKLLLIIATWQFDVIKKKLS